jgi:transposase-like protein
MVWRCSPSDVARCQLMSQSDQKLGGKREAAVLALLSTRTVEEAARVVGVNARTLYRWLKEPEFDAAYRAGKRAAYGQSIARLHYLSSAAVSTLRRVMVDPATPPATKVRAADSILDHTAKAIEIEVIDARVRQLEEATSQSKQHR